MPGAPSIDPVKAEDKNSHESAKLPTSEQIEQYRKDILSDVANGLVCDRQGRLLQVKDVEQCQYIYGINEGRTYINCKVHGHGRFF